MGVCNGNRSTLIYRYIKAEIIMLEFLFDTRKETTHVYKRGIKFECTFLFLRNIVGIHLSFKCSNVNLDLSSSCHVDIGQ